MNRALIIVFACLLLAEISFAQEWQYYGGDAGGMKYSPLAQITKMGFIFVFDRVTGKPLFDIEERPVPPSNVPGEAAWPTQPFPSIPPIAWM